MSTGRRKLSCHASWRMELRADGAAEGWLRGRSRGWLSAERRRVQRTSYFNTVLCCFSVDGTNMDAHSLDHGSEKACFCERGSRQSNGRGPAQKRYFGPRSSASSLDLPAVSRRDTLDFCLRVHPKRERRTVQS
ncbi:hypothetical protein DL95DRAFT_396002 [Leptodontidium sp. 2 PMI_412]|nr:hypothetical protein DL95DRAFT_396002 [Leptodontidium sp. 2 PMI_412]